MPLLNGAWNITVNGNSGTMNINMIGADGGVTGNINIAGSAVQFMGSWNEAAQSIYFETMTMLIIPADNPPGTTGQRSQFFGWLYSSRDAGVPGADVKWVFCGYLSSSLVNPFPGLPVNTRRTTFGWTAEINQVI